jgi:hypothetical protein
MCEDLLITVITLSMLFDHGPALCDDVAIMFDEVIAI